jgi:two-component system LytT family response regulator
MTCIAVDDEPKALEILEYFIGRTPFLELSGTFRDPFLAMEFISKNKPDLVFLDINMPELSGIQLLRSLRTAPMIILTTAYSEYAIDSYELDVIDYLLKPFEFERFLKAVMKAKELSQLKHEREKREIIPERLSENVIYIKSGTKTFRIRANSILYIEGLGNYVTFVLADRKIVTYLSIQEALNMLPANLFCRIHKSYIISLKHIDVIEKHQVIIKDKAIPIGSTFRENLSGIIEKK